MVKLLEFYNKTMEENKLIQLENFKKETKKTLEKLTPILQKTAVGDFSSEIEIPEEENEFTELLVGLKLMIEDLKEISDKKEREQKEKFQEVKKNERSLVEEIEDKTQELTIEKAHMEAIIENLSSGLVEYDGTFCIKRINAAAEEMLGVKREDVLNTKVMPENKEDKGKESLTIVSYPVLAKKGKRTSKEVFGKSVSKHELTVDFPKTHELEVVTIPLTNYKTSEREGFVKIIRDITKEKEISRSKSDFINIAAHQLRTPLSAVKWVLRMILDGDVGSLGSSQRKLLDKGYETNEKMIMLVNDLLNVARIEDNRFGYVFKEGNIVEAITDAVDELRLMAEKGDIDLIFEKPDDIPLFVFDFSKVQLAFHNLINNAIKYTRAGGTVSVSIKKVKEEIVAEVKDTGVGIPKNQMEQMFNKFFRAENVIRLQVGGSGLGLFIVKDVVTRHGGTITVESIENKGTIFTLKMPIKHTIKDNEKDLSA